MPFRALQPLIDTLLKHHPEKARTAREREQADEIYKSGQSIRVSSFAISSPFCINLSSDRSHHPENLRHPQMLTGAQNTITLAHIAFLTIPMTGGVLSLSQIPEAI